MMAWQSQRIYQPYVGFIMNYDGNSLETSGFGGRNTYSLRHRIFRLLWSIAWLLLARWTPPQFRKWRRLLIRLFGSDIHPTADVRSSVTIWYPPNLKMGAFSSMGPKVNCYCQDVIEIGAYAVISQNSHLCTGSHDIKTVDFRHFTKPISIGDNAWICADSFVGPGVRVGDGAVLGARAATFKNLDSWSVYQGNPAERIRSRPQFERPLP